MQVQTYPTGFDCDTLPIPHNFTAYTYKFPPTLTNCNETILSPLLGPKDSGQWHWAKLCLIMGGDWDLAYIHFNHLLASYLALYQTATFEGWMEVISDGVDHNPTVSFT